MEDTYRIGVTGSRNWKREGHVRRALRHTVREAEALGLRPVLVHGNCPTGADWMADKIWRSWLWVPEIFYADWDNCDQNCPSTPHRTERWASDRHHPGTLPDWCPKAGPRRNQLMVNSGLDVLLAFPTDGGRRSGTWSCIYRAEKAGVRVVLPGVWDKDL